MGRQLWTGIALTLAIGWVAPPTIVPQLSAAPADPDGPPPLPVALEPESAARPSPKIKGKLAPLLDPGLKRAQAPAEPEQNPLPVAKEPPGQPAPGPGAVVGDLAPGESYVLPPERLPLGKQSIGLTVEVLAPQFLNLSQEATLKIVVRNTGAADATGVVVRDELPSSLTFLNSQPAGQQTAALLAWKLGNVPAGSERTILVRVKPNRIGAFDHAATVTLQAGGKARTIVREPKLKVEQIVNTTKALKGDAVEFKITVTNTGDGPARRVVVQAKLTPGLRHESGEPNDQNLFEQTLEQLDPGQRMVLDPLVADTLAGGEQTCTVAVHSPDVAPGADDARSVQRVTVTEPQLKLAIAGPVKRETDRIATYVLNVENPGSATARKLRVGVLLPLPGKLVALPSGAQFDRSTRQLIWPLSQLDPGEKVKLSCQVKMGGIGVYHVAAEARAEGGLADKRTLTTDVIGMSDVNFAINETRRVIDIDDTTVFLIKIQNNGTKEATRLSLSAQLSDTCEPLSTDIEGNEQAQWNPAERKLIFPIIERLSAGKEIELAIRVKALKAGQASCKIALAHDELTEKLEHSAAFRVTETRRQ